MSQSAPTPEIHEQMMFIAEAIYGTHDDPEQMRICDESWRKLQSISSNCLRYEVDSEGKPISWVLALPTTIELMERFLTRQINEQQILDLTPQLPMYDAVYLLSAITVPEHRRRGLSFQLGLETLQLLPITPNAKLFAYPVSAEGAALTEKFAAFLNRPIATREGSALPPA